MINPKPCKCNPTNNRQMEANEKKSKNFLIIKNRTEHVLEEHKHTETKINNTTKKNIRYQAAVKERRNYLWGDCGL